MHLTTIPREVNCSSRAINREQQVLERRRRQPWPKRFMPLRTPQYCFLINPLFFKREGIGMERLPVRFRPVRARSGPWSTPCGRPIPLAAFRERLNGSRAPLSPLRFLPTLFRAPASDEGRGWLRKVSVSCQASFDPVMSEWGNPMGVMAHKPGMNT